MYFVGLSVCLLLPGIIVVCMCQCLHLCVFAYFVVAVAVIVVIIVCCFCVYNGMTLRCQSKLSCALKLYTRRQETRSCVTVQ